MIPRMSFFAILFALLIEQVKPPSPTHPLHGVLRNWAGWISENFDAGRAQHGWIAWSLAVLLPAVASVAIYWALASVSVVLAFLWNMAVLYFTLGFRQFSHHFTDIREALDSGDEALARTLLARWQQVDASELPRSEIVRHAIEHSVLAAHRHVFGVLCWFSVLSALGLGPAGAVVFRMAEFVQRYWKRAAALEGASSALCSAAGRAWHAIDFIPARATALGFAVVGSFEDAIDCWRNYAQRFPDDNDGVILAATSGAVNVRLGGEALKPSLVGELDGATAFAAEALGAHAAEDTESTPGREPEPAHLRSIVGLVWRSVVLWMLLIALLTLAHLIG